MTSGFPDSGSGIRVGDPKEFLMREFMAWIVEQACRPFDTMVCEIGNLDDETEPSYWVG